VNGKGEEKRKKRKRRRKERKGEGKEKARAKEKDRERERARERRREGELVRQVTDSFQVSHKHNRMRSLRSELHHECPRGQQILHSTSLEGCETDK